MLCIHCALDACNFNFLIFNISYMRTLNNIGYAVLWTASVPVFLCVRYAGAQLQQF